MKLYDALFQNKTNLNKSYYKTQFISYGIHDCMTVVLTGYIYSLTNT